MAERSMTDADREWLMDAVRRAETLGERRARRPSAEPHPDDTARLRLAAWRRREPFTSDELWTSRLRSAQLTEAELLAMASPPRTGDPPLAVPIPPWAELVVRSGFLAENPAPLPPWLRIDDAGQGQAPENFLSVAAIPLLETGRDALLAYVRARSREEGGSRFDSAAVVDQLFEPLTGLTHRMLARTMALSLARARPEIPEDRGWEAFLASLATQATRRSLLSEYPILFRQIATAVLQWIDAGRLLIDRILSDWNAIAAAFGGELPLGSLVAVETGLGDRHCRGLTVACLRFSSGVRVVYKPRSLAVEAHFQDLLAWINRRGVSLPLRTLAVLERGSYGWMEFAPRIPCTEPAALHHFYRRHGFLLGVLHLLRAQDFHAENIIAAGDQPLLIDLESVLMPEMPLDDPRISGAEKFAERAARGSVLATGLLPQPSWLTVEGEAIDVSGLGQSPDVSSPVPVPRLIDIGQPTMRIALEYKSVGGVQHRPVEADQALDLRLYRDDILAGFAESYRLLLAHREELKDPSGPIAAFSGDRVRVIVRPTMLYGAVLGTAFHPDVLRDGLEREQHFDSLWREVPRIPTLSHVIESERYDLWNSDIPYFTARTNSTCLMDSREQQIPGFPMESALDGVWSQLDRLSEDGLAQQTWFLHGALGTVMAQQHRIVQRPRHSPEERDRGEPVDLLAAADRVGHRLRQLAFRVGDTAQWLGVNATQDREWSLGRLRPDLFSGLLGVSFFLAHLGALTGDERHTELARSAQNTALSQIEYDALRTDLGMSGYGGVIFALCHLARLWDRDDLLTTAERLAERVIGRIADDDEYDIITGASGAIAGLRSLYALRPSDRVRHAIARAAEHLVWHTTETPHGVGWLGKGMHRQARVPISGFSHGVGGIAWTLFEAAAILDEPRFRRTALEALRYEQHTFDPDRHAWRELRELEPYAVLENAPPLVAWCYGGCGIGLSRVLMHRHHTDARSMHEIDAAIDLVRDHGFGSSQCQCHGDYGNIELLLNAAAVLDRPDLHAEGIAWAHASARINQGAWVCGTLSEIEVPGMMTGLAGIGLGMLRAHAPSRVPSVLTFQTP
ncbi:type 2 lanthipeptide synthetase LanM family protein [Pendulispora albinea]|uniref:Type 2 lantipeptide synthetase LanM family protein n=1 Tax=Pendulispora albinea TaxID=2741071 RepID=A0ABZ2LP44_9BACT